MVGKLVVKKKRVEANRRNAAKSTGPKTSAGKAVVKYNAMTHGLLATEIALPDEDGRRARQAARTDRERSHDVEQSGRHPHQQAAKLLILESVGSCRVTRVPDVRRKREASAQDAGHDHRDEQPRDRRCLRPCFWSA
jgi:uncharacterized membrane protein